MIPGIQGKKQTARFTNMWKTVDTILWITTPKTVDNWA